MQEDTFLAAAVPVMAQAAAPDDEQVCVLILLADQTVLNAGISKITDILRGPLASLAHRSFLIMPALLSGVVVLQGSFDASVTAKDPMPAGLVRSFLVHAILLAKAHYSRRSLLFFLLVSCAGR